MQIRIRLPDMRQISTQCGSSYAGNLKFWANIAKKIAIITLLQPRIKSDTLLFTCTYNNWALRREETEQFETSPLSYID